MFHPKSMRLFSFYFFNITLKTNLPVLTLGVTRTVLKKAGEMRRLLACFDNPDISYKVCSENLVFNQNNIICLQFCVFSTLVFVVIIQHTQKSTALFSDYLTCHGNQGLCQMFLLPAECQFHLKSKQNSKVKTL